MFHACVRKFDVTDTAQTFLGTKRPRDVYHIHCDRLAVAGGWWLVLICYEKTVLLTGW